MVSKDFNPLVREITAHIPSVRRYANVAGAGLKTWSFSNRVTLLGDAAHTHGGAFAAGASLAIDDAYALYLSLLVAIPTTSTTKPLTEQLRFAFDLYEKTRRPQSDRVLRIVHDIFEGNKERLRAFWEEGIEEDDVAFRERIGNRLDPSWLTEHDVVGAFEKVLADETRGSESARL